MSRKTARRQKRSAGAAAPKISPAQAHTIDSFQNFALQLGLQTDNALAASSYSFNPITRNRQLLEWIYRGSWIGGVAVDAVADDMTRGGVELNSTIPPEDVEAIQHALVEMGVWNGLNEVIKWSRLYGGAIGVILIDGQRPDTPLRIETVGRGQFRGVLPLDRWMVDPDLSNPVTEYGPNLGNPRFYRVTADAPALMGASIHHSRVLRMEGVRLPHWQRKAENLWGISVLERLYDRLIAFDAATTGAAQLVHKTHIRTFAIDGLREIAAAGGPAYQGLLRFMDLMRRFQSNEGITLIDGKDQFIPHTASVQSGISDALVQFGQQISGALQIPLVRLFGQSPAGLSSTGESDLRTYYDGVVKMQERLLRVGLTRVLRIAAQSRGVQLPHDFGFTFNSLWLMSDAEKADIASKDTQTTLSAQEAGLVDQATALRELRQSSRATGRWTNVTDEMIEEMEAAEPPLAERLAQQQGGGGGAGGLEAMLGGLGGAPDSPQKPGELPAQGGGLPTQRPGSGGERPGNHPPDQREAQPEHGAPPKPTLGRNILAFLKRRAGGGR